jgi:hypothetical protein
MVLEDRLSTENSSKIILVHSFGMVAIFLLINLIYIHPFPRRPKYLKHEESLQVSPPDLVTLSP